MSGQSTTESKCSSCLAYQKSLKVQQADYEFELKKIKQDKSTEKALYQIHLQKEVRRWQQEYNKQKSYRQYENVAWIEKYDKTSKNYENQITKNTEDLENKFNKQIQFIKFSTTEKYNKTVQEYESRLQNTKNEYETQIKQLKQKNQQKVFNLTQDHQKILKNLRSSHTVFIDELTKKFQGKILGLTTENNKQKQLHDKTKQEAKNLQSKLYQDIYKLKKKVTELQSTIQSLKQTIKTRNASIQNYKSEIQKLNEEHLQQIKRIKEENIQKLKEYQQNYKIKLKSAYEDTLHYCNKYQQTIKKMEQKRQTEKQLYLSNISEIQQSLETRMSRPEDLFQIERLRSELARKTKQSDLMSQELKWFRLELENKQETYNKIFVPLNTVNNENIAGRRKQFKLRRQGRSVTTVREILMSMGSNQNIDKKIPTITKTKML